MEESTAAPIPEYAGHLKHEPVARLFDEIMKLLFSGHARECLKKLNSLGVSDDIHPLLTALKSAEKPENRIISLALKNTDERLRQDKSVSVGFVLAAVLWPDVNRRWQRNLAQGQKPAPALTDAIESLRSDVEKGWGVPQRFAATMREIWQFQPQFEQMRGARPHRLLAQQRFRAAYDFLVLRGEVGEIDRQTVEWWNSFQHADEGLRNEMTTNHARAQGNEGVKKKRRRRPRKKKTEQWQ